MQVVKDKDNQNSKTWHGRISLFSLSPIHLDTFKSYFIFSWSHMWCFLDFTIVKPAEAHFWPLLDQDPTWPDTCIGFHELLISTLFMWTLAKILTFQIIENLTIKSHSGQHLHSLQVMLCYTVSNSTHCMKMQNINLQFCK